MSKKTTLEPLQPGLSAKKSAKSRKVIPAPGARKEQKSTLGSPVPSAASLPTKSGIKAPAPSLSSIPTGPAHKESTTPSPTHRRKPGEQEVKSGKKSEKPSKPKELPSDKSRLRPVPPLPKNAPQRAPSNLFGAPLQRTSCITSIMTALGLRNEHIYLQKAYAKEAAMALNLQQWHLQKLKAQFAKIDVDKSGAISVDELFASLGEIRSPFTDKLFELIDIDASGTMEFEEYVHVMATYCMFSKEEILNFCFGESDHSVDLSVCMPR